MTRYTYLIVGGGMAAAAAVNGIRELDGAGTIGLIGAEPERPYNRPPLSKGLWRGDSLDGIWASFPDQGVDLHLGRTAVALHAKRHEVIDDQGSTYSYERLLLATGGTPRRLPYGGDQILYYRTLRDYQALRARLARGGRVAVIGGGFIGSEIAAALAGSGVAVSLIFPGRGIGASTYPPDLVAFLGEYYRDKGVDLHPDTSVTGIAARENGYVLQLTDTETGQARELGADHVVAGIGIEPNTALASAGGLEVQDGVLVDPFLRTSAPDVYAAGDVARYPDAVLGKRRRVEHEDQAVTMGRAAGRAMAGAAEPYRHLPFFYSDLFDLGYEAVGDLDSGMQLVADWKKPFRKGVIYYLLQGRVRGVLLWNTWNQVDAARALIAAPGPFQPEDLIGRLPAKKPA